MDKQEIFLLEYQEICAYQRHEDSIKWSTLGLTYAGAAALISWALVNAKPTVASFAMLVGAVFIYVGGRVYEQYQQMTLIRLIRAREIERKLGMNNQCLIEERSNTKKEKEEPVYRGGLAKRIVSGSKIVAILLVCFGAVMFCMLIFGQEGIDLLN